MEQGLFMREDRTKYWYGKKDCRLQALRSIDDVCVANPEITKKSRRKFHTTESGQFLFI